MSCLQQAEEGVWSATDPSNAITRVALRFNCQDLVLNGEPYPPGPPWYVHLWGQCSPSDCDWGEVGGRRLDNGVIYSTYDQGFARRGVHLQAVSQGELWIYVYTHFVDGSGRADYAIEQFMRPVPGSLRLQADSYELDAFRKRRGATAQFQVALSTDLEPRSGALEIGVRDAPQPLPAPSART